MPSNIQLTQEKTRYRLCIASLNNGQNIRVDSKEKKGTDCAVPVVDHFTPVTYECSKNLSIV